MGDGQVAAVDGSVLAGYSAPFRRLVVRRFRETAPTVVAGAFVACELGDADAAWGHVHRLKGEAPYVGATELVWMLLSASSTCARTRASS